MQRPDYDHNKFYSSGIWKKLRNGYREKHPLCQMCKANGIITVMQKGDPVDHIHEILDGGPKLDPRNLMSQCRSCHDKKTKEMVERRKHGLEAVMEYVKELMAMVGR